MNTEDKGDTVKYFNHKVNTLHKVMDTSKKLIAYRGETSEDAGIQTPQQ